MGEAGGYLYLIWPLEIFITSICGMNSNGDRHLSVLLSEVYIEGGDSEIQSMEGRKRGCEEKGTESRGRENTNVCLPSPV